MSDEETLFGMPLPGATIRSAESKSKQSKKSEPAAARPASIAEIWFFRGTVLGIVMTGAMFVIGDHLGLHRREAVDNGIRARLTEWMDANPKATVAEVLAAVRSGESSPQKCDSTAAPQSTLVPSAK